MYSFIEIDAIFSNCVSREELNRVQKAFTMVIEEHCLSNKKIFFIRKKARLRLCELEKLK
jgi:hypothetical protein